MNNGIKKGDLVYVAEYPCCGIGLGFVGKLEQIIGDNLRECSHCKTPMPNGDIVMIRVRERAVGHLPMSWLRKIDPPSEGETREAYVNLKQPRKVTA